MRNFQGCFCQASAHLTCIFAARSSDVDFAAHLGFISAMKSLAIELDAHLGFISATRSLAIELDARWASFLPRGPFISRRRTFRPRSCHTRAERYFTSSCRMLGPCCLRRALRTHMQVSREGVSPTAHYNAHPRFRISHAQATIPSTHAQTKRRTRFPGPFQSRLNLQVTSR